MKTKTILRILFIVCCPITIPLVGIYIIIGAIVCSANDMFKSLFGD